MSDRLHQLGVVRGALKVFRWAAEEVARDDFDRRRFLERIRFHHESYERHLKGLQESE